MPCGPSRWHLAAGAYKVAVMSGTAKVASERVVDPEDPRAAGEGKVGVAKHDEEGRDPQEGALRARAGGLGTVTG